MQASNTNNTPNDPFYDFINNWSFPIGLIGIILGITTETNPFVIVGIGLMFMYVLLGDISE
jgi:hypothetical protein